MSAYPPVPPYEAAPSGPAEKKPPNPGFPTHAPWGGNPPPQPPQQPHTVLGIPIPAQISDHFGVGGGGAEGESS